MPLAPPAAQDADVDARVRAELERRLAVAPAMMHSINEQGRLVFVSDTWLAKLGYARDEVLGRLSSDFLTPESRAYAAREVLPEFFRTGRCENVEYQMVCKDGHVIDVLLSAVVDEASPGGGRSSIAVIADVTTLKETKRALADSEARYRFLADNSADLIMLVDGGGRRAFVSPACEAMLGFSPQEMLAMNTADTVHPDDADRVFDTLAARTRNQAELTLSYRMRRKDGGYVWVEANLKPVAMDGRTDLLIAVVRNVDARIEADRRLQESEARYRLLADNSSDMVFQLDRDMVRRYVSPACREILGYAPEELIGKKPINMVHPDDAARLTLVYQSLLSGAVERQAIVNRIRHRNGHWIWVEARFRALKDPDGGATIGILGALRDVSARKAVEDKLAEANRRLQALADQDSLTGLANRRAFDEALAKEHLRARRERQQLALIMIDVDHFKAFNDIYGHPAGDDCLRRVARAIASTIARPGDLAVRYGGEEFAVLLPNTDEAGATLIAERISQTVLGLALPHEANANGLVTVSAGVAALVCTEDWPEALMLSADRALYRAKDFGRNAVIRASEVAPAAALLSPAVA